MAMLPSGRQGYISESTTPQWLRSTGAPFHSQALPKSRMREQWQNGNNNRGNDNSFVYILCIFPKEAMGRLHLI